MTRRLIVLLLATAAGLAGAVVLPAAPGAVATDGEVTYRSFTADYTLSRAADGHARLDVVETIVADFPETGENHGILRSIPLGDPTTHARYGVRAVSVTDETGAAVHYGTSVEDDFRILKIGDAATLVHGEKTYVIRYTESDVVGYFADTRDDEFYWDVNGDGWPTSFGSVAATVHLAGGLSSKLNGQTSCYPPTGECALDRTADGFHVTVGEVPGYSTLTIAIGFAPHTFVAPPDPDKAWPVAVLPWVAFGILLALLVTLILLRALAWRGPRPGIIVPEYEGPDIGVMQAAALLGKAPRGLPAELVHLVVSGAARLVEQPEAPRSQRYRLDAVDRDALGDAEDGRAFDAVFHEETSRTLDQTDQALGDRLQALQLHVASSLRAQRLTERRRSRFTPIAIVLALLCVAGQAVAIVAGAVLRASSNAMGLVILLLFASIVLMIVVIALAIPPLRLSAKGAAVRDHLLGLRMYLELAEADRLRVLQSPQGAERTRIDTTDRAAIVKLYERLLPWAIVWGVEDQWAKTLGEHYATTPEATDTAFAGTSVLIGMGAFSQSMQPSSFATTPSTSSGSWSGSGSTSSFGGSSGGGFSGGGGGGGGGGSW